MKILKIQLEGKKMKYYKTNNSIVFTKNNKYVILTKTKNGVKITNVSDEDVDWITVRGNHIPVKKGQSKTDAIRDFIKSKKSVSGTGSKKDSGKESGKSSRYDDVSLRKIYRNAYEDGRDDADYGKSVSEEEVKKNVPFADDKIAMSVYMKAYRDGQDDYESTTYREEDEIEKMSEKAISSSEKELTKKDTKELSDILKTAKEDRKTLKKYGQDTTGVDKTIAWAEKQLKSGTGATKKGQETQTYTSSKGDTYTKKQLEDMLKKKQEGISKTFKHIEKLREEAKKLSKQGKPYKHILELADDFENGTETEREGITNLIGLLIQMERHPEEKHFEYDKTGGKTIFRNRLTLSGDE